MIRNMILVVVLVLLTISVGLNFNFYKNTKLDENNQLTSDNLFKKKQECQKYSTQIENKIKELDLYNPNTQYQSSHFLEEIFYSSKENTCLYIEKEWGLINNKLTWETLTLNDVLTGDMLLSSMREVGSKEYLQQKTGFENILKEDYR